MSLNNCIFEKDIIIEIYEQHLQRNDHFITC